MTSGSTLAPGTQLGPYEVVALIGRGAMGEVYRARDARLGRDVAVKVLPADFAGDAVRLRRFETEVHAVSQLSHPNVVAVFDVGVTEGSPFVVTELLEGQTLRSRLSSGPIGARRAVELAAQAARGLAAAHERGLVHRDVKPENLIVTRSGLLKVLDFGLVKLTRLEPGGGPSGGGQEMLTTPGLIMGTPGYFSPEQVRGEEVDHRSDIFSLGAVLHEMLTGKQLFPGASAFESMTAVLANDPPDLPQVVRDAVPGLAPVLLRCLEKDREDRFSSARDLAYVLEGLLGSRSTGGVAAPRPARRAGLERFALGLAAGLILAGLLVGAVVMTGRLVRGPITVASFRQLTFRRGTVWTARFTPDSRSVIYSAAWETPTKELYSIALDSSDSRPFGQTDTDVLAIAPSGQMAVLLRKSFNPGTLALMPLAGGPARELLEGVTWADWDPRDSRSVVVRPGSGGQTLEFPAGTVLYTSPGALNYPRLSPGRDRIAVLEHLDPSSDGGRVLLVELDGRARPLCDGWGSLEGLGWRPDGREVWFTAAREGTQSALWGVTRAGKLRLLLRAPGRLVLHDVSGDGRIVAESNFERGSMVASSAPFEVEREIPWNDFSLPVELSADGRKVLFFESGEAARAGPIAYLRGVDGSHPVRLGEGTPLALSPDGRVALTANGSPPQLTLLPTGPGQAQPVGKAQFSAVLRAAFFPDGSRLLLLGAEAGSGPRLYTVALPDGPAIPISPENAGLFANSISPDGSRVAALVNGVPVLLAVSGGEPVPIPGLAAGNVPVRFTADGRSLYVLERRGAIPARVFLLDLATGAKRPWRDLAPSDTAGVLAVTRILIAADESSYVYSYFRLLSNLYLIDDVK